MVEQAIQTIVEMHIGIEASDYFMNHFVPIQVLISVKFSKQVYITVEFKNGN